jgi:RNA polymerase sigma-70 factor (family 1)
LADYSTFSDQVLSLLLKVDDREAFAEIYERYKKPLYIHAFHRLRDREEAQDLIQQLFATLWDNRKTIELKSHLSGYLYTSVRNRVFKFIARQQVASTYITSIEQSINAGDCITDHLVREKELQRMIEKEVAALPTKMREIFELSRKSHLSHQQIAEQLELSEKTVRNQVNNALKVLRVKLGMLSILLFLMNL